MKTRCRSHAIFSASLFCRKDDVTFFYFSVHNIFKEVFGNTIISSTSTPFFLPSSSARKGKRRIEENGMTRNAFNFERVVLKRTLAHTQTHTRLHISCFTRRRKLFTRTHTQQQQHNKMCEWQNEVVGCCSVCCWNGLPAGSGTTFE